MAKGVKGLKASAKAVDPTLDALFSASAGPVKAPPTSRYSALIEKKPRPAPEPTKQDPEVEEGDDEELSEISEELSYGDEDEDDEDEDEDESTPSEESETESKADDNEVSMADVSADIDAVVKAAEGDQPKRERKRKRKDDHEDLEAKYLNKLAEEDEPAEPAEKRQKGDGDDAGEEDDDDDEVPVHETLAKDAGASDIEKATRTVFLANVSVEAISSKAAKKTLTTHLASVLDTEATPPEKIESIRFRSVAFAGGSMPKRAAYITKTLMDATTKSANAYVVYTTAAAARNAATKLNGTEVLGRHIRADSVAHPSPTDHRRCVFVGNLGFVDDETVLKTNADGETTEKKRNKVPADIEEGLWRTFGTQGRKVENVRVVRDSRTRVGKGFAYVQFYDTNDVESALLLDGKKFPPMLPRALRVTRAKDPRKTALAQERTKAKALQTGGAQRNTKYKVKATPEQQSMAGRTQKLLGRSAAAQQRHGKKPFRGDSNGEPAEAAVQFKTPEQVIFEGRRASAKDGTPKDLKLGKTKKSKGRPHRPQGRGARRAAEWKKKDK